MHHACRQLRLRRRQVQLVGVIGSHFESEILEQPRILAEQLQTSRAAVEALAATIRSRSPQYVVIAARGSSDNAARYAQYLFGAHNRLVVALAAPSLFTLYAAPPLLSSALVIGISQSGQSPDIVSVVAEARRQGALTLGITNDAESPLGDAAEHVFSLLAGEERAVAASKTYTAQLVALGMLSAALQGEAARWRELAELPERVARALDARPAALAASARCRFAERFVVVGRGFNYATAFELALKIQETSYVIAQAYSSADLLHGPAAMLDGDLPLIVVASSHRAADTTALLDALRGRHAEVIAISDDAGVLARAQTAIELPAGVPEWLSPVVAVVPGQLFALELALARGLDPDRPRGLTKVTQTI
jgi:glucosamine--fructose-6-phosphate aminotransferase (isomerizing)